MYSDQSSTNPACDVRLSFATWPVPHLAATYSAREIDVVTALIAIIGWRASVLGPVTCMVIDATERTAISGSVSVDPDCGFTSVIDEVKRSLAPVDDIAHQACDVALIWNGPVPEDVAASLVVTVNSDPESGEATASYVWDPDKFDRAYVTTWHGHVEMALHSLVENPAVLVKECRMVTDRERDLIDEANATTHPITDCHYVYDFLNRALLLHADEVALSSAQGSMTYAEMATHVDALAAHLRDIGVDRGDDVALLGDRGIWLVIGMFAIMKAGGVIVPLSRAYPRSRIDEILQDSRARIALVTNVAYQYLLPANVTLVDLHDSAIFAASSLVTPINEPDDLCAVLYTSGTSGVPKGVMVRHSTIVNAAENCRDEWRFGSTDAEPQFAPATFIAAINEVAFAMAAGGTLFLPCDDIIKDPRAFTLYAVEHKVTHIVTTPDYAQYLGPIPTVRTVVTLGSQCPPQVSAHLSQYEHINVYGLTEAGLALYWRREPGQPIPNNLPIGRPIWNTQAYVVRDQMECGMYMPGELCLTGACLSAGYKNLPDVTEQHFVPNPYGDGVMFRTGDIVQWDADGNIDYIGRGDEQVQIHGQRVELGEVNNALLSLPGITQCCAIACTDSAGDPAIAAFIVADLPVDCTALRDRLSQTMVAYMVPSRLIQIDQIPRSENGKYDKRALLERLDTLPFVQARADSLSPDGLEAQLCHIIEEVLPGSSVSPNDSFFSLGGDSLTGVRFINEVEDQIGIRLPVARLFEHPTPQELAAAIRTQMEEEFRAHRGQHIVSVGGPGVYPASSQQRRLFVVDQLDQEGISYHIPVVVRIGNRVDCGRLGEAVQQLADRHEVLRTSFFTDDDGEVMQRVHDHVDISVDVIQVDDVSDQTAQRVLSHFIRPFDLGVAPLVRVMLAQGPDDQSLLLFDAHHSVVDGTSMTLMVEEFSRLYDGEKLAPVEVDYKDYTAWFVDQDSGAARQYWADQFADLPAAVDLPTDHPRPALQTFAGATLTRTISPEGRAQVEDIARTTGATQAMVVMAGWCAVLGRYGRTNDLVIGMPVTGRVHPDTEHMVGMFVNTLPLRVHPHSNEPFTTLIDEVRETMVNGLTHQSYPLEDILDQIGLTRDQSRNPLFDTALVFQNFAPADLDLVGLDAHLVPVDTIAANLDISVYITPVPDGGYQVVMEYRTDLFSQETIEYLFRHLETCLDHATRSPSTPMGQISLIDKEEQDFLDRINDTGVPLRDVTVTDLFDEQVLAQPDSVAAVCDGMSWSYRELDTHVRSVTARLNDIGVGPGDFVVVMTSRSLEMVAAILGVVKAGAAYVPISLDSPAVRIAAIVDSCHPAAAVTYEASMPSGLVDCPIIDLAGAWDSPDAGPERNPGIDDHRPGMDDPAYCIYTSGSTGVPKGVVITHRSLSAFAQEPGLQDLYHSCAKPMFVATADYSFDMSVTEWFTGLTRGVPVVVATEAQCVDQHRFAQLVRSSGATIIQATPTRLRMLTAEADERDYLNDIELFLVGGESVPQDLLVLLSEHSQARIQIMYGPTEATCWSTMGRWTPGEPVTIGRPLGNQQIYVESGSLCGIGMPGEVCVAGSGLAQGYLGDPQLTSEKFVQDNTGDKHDDTEKRCYHTGDLGLWTPDGNLRFLGRIDTQVKVHGVRIETGEVEHVIRNFDGITDAAVVARPVGGETALCAYYTTDRDVTIDGLRNFVGENLPRTMLPSYWTRMDHLPVNRSGKLDAGALPEPEAHFAGYLAPFTPDEQMVAQAMCQVLDLERVGAKDDFFALGGDSLKAMRLVNQIERKSGVTLSLHDVFRNPCVDTLAGMITNRNGIFEPIVSVGGAGTYPASSPQRRLFVIDQLDFEQAAYHSPVVVRLRGQIDQERLRDSFQEMVDRHEVLRTSFLTGPDGEVLQQVHPHLGVVLESTEITDASDETAYTLLSRFVRRFDLGEAPLVRMMLARGPDESLLLFDAHHIILDGTSMTIVVEEFCELYRGETLPPEEVDYKDYTAWMAAHPTEGAEQYWTSQFADPPAALDLPTDYPRPPLQTFNGSALSRSWPLRPQVEEFARQTGATEAMVWMAAWGAVLSRYGQSDDLVVGMPVSGRVHPDTERMMGMFVNTVPIRVGVQEGLSFEQLVGEVRDTMVDAVTYQSYPLEDILDRIDCPRDLSRNPLFDTVMAFQNFAPAAMELDGLDAQVVYGGFGGLARGDGDPDEVRMTRTGMTQGARFDLSISITPVVEAYDVEVEYRTDLFTADTVDYVARHLETFLIHAMASPHAAVGTLSMIDDAEQTFLDQLNDTAMPLPNERTIPELFTHVVREFPDKIALVGEGREITYQELDERVRRIAARLRSCGVGRDDLVGIYVNRGLSAIEGMLGAIVAGGAYVVLDPAWPETRLRYVCADAHPKAIIVHDEALPFASGVPVVYLGDPDLATGPPPVLDVVNQPDDLAYCVYTSGSTGEPKGVLIEHLGVCNLVNVACQYGIGPEDRILQYASPTVDASVAEWAHALLVGGTLIVPTETEASDIAWLNSHLTSDVTVMTAPPALIPHLDISLLPRLISAGAQARPAPGFAGVFVNGYGPTEASVCSALWVQPGHVWPDPVPIGHPRANLRAYLRDSSGGICGIGVPGELCVSGVGLARGYLGDPDLTARKFVDNPFDADENQFGRLYRTGDVAVWGPDGNLRFLNRIDEQLKIHGVRIEPGEIEHVIRDDAGVIDAVVTARPDHDGELALCAYYVGDVDADEVRQFAAARLPRTMVPSYWTKMDHLPTNRSGKIDISALPSPDIRHAAYVEPSTPAEHLVAEAMCSVLGLDKVGGGDDFFALGGDSLKAMQLVNQIEQFSGVRLRLRDVFQNPHVGELAAMIGNNPRVFQPIVSVGGAGSYPASSQQKRLFVIDQLDPQALAYHVPAAVRFKDRVDPHVDIFTQFLRTTTRLEKVFEELVDRHEVLRTSFTTDNDGQVIQEIHDHLETSVGGIQLDDIGDDAVRAIMRLFIHPFDLGKAPLVRMSYVQGPTDESLLLFDAHHIILDGMSMTELVDEFFRLYRGEEVPVEKVQYKDYSAWVASQDMGAARCFWADQLVDPPTALDLPTDHPRPGLQTFSGATLTRQISAEVREKVEELAHRAGATGAMVMMAAWGAVLGRYGRTDDLVVGMPVSGRVHPDTEKMLGMFVNTVPIRVRPRLDASFEGFLGEVRETMVNSLGHQSYPLEDILEQIDLPRDLSRNPLFDTALVFQNFVLPGEDPAFGRMTREDGRMTSEGGDPASGGMTGVTNVSDAIVRTGAKFDLSATVTPVPDEGYQVELEYRTDLFGEESADYLFRHFSTFLDHATSSPSTRLGEVSMIDEVERRFLDQLNETDMALPDQHTIPELFSHVVNVFANKVAVVCDGQEWTYQELDERVRHIAARLRDLGVGRNDLVGVYAPRGLPLIESILGVIVAGGAYIGMDPAWPPARLEHILGDAKPQVLLVDDTAIDPGIPILDINEPDFFNGPAPLLDPINQPGDLAYCIYTSGSTGEPKGVLIEHLGVCNLINVAHQFGVSADDRILQYASISFDASVWEWAHSLLIGGTLIVPTETEVNDIAWLNTHLAADVTMMTAPPALIPHLDVSTLRLLVSAGSQARAAQGFTGVFVNGYGPTETTVCSALWIHDVSDAWPDPVPIGRPRANAHVYVADANGNLCGIDVPGEMCVSGVGLARGYLGDPDLTSQKFVENRFEPAGRSCLRQADNGPDQDDITPDQSDKGFGRLYRTGDVVVWGPDGNLRFLGRVDAQVKIHGIRIEPGEIEHVLRDCPGLADAIVVARPDHDELALCAYYVPDPGVVIEPDQLRTFAAGRLPRTMLPSYWTQIDQVPLTGSGKVDEAALPDPEARSAGYVEASTPAERQVAEAMGQVLGVDKVGARDDFFALGGDSLKAMQLVNQLEARASTRLTLQDVFQNPRVDRLASLVDGHGGVFEPIVSVGGPGAYPASSSQRRLYVIDQLDPQGLAYHVPTTLRISGSLDPSRLQLVFQELVDRHEALRTSFATGTDGEVLQVVHSHVDATIQVIQVDDIAQQSTEFVRPFDLGEAPLVRLTLVQGPDDESLLVFDAHHIVLDGTSMTLLLEEFSRLWRGEELALPTSDYKDYSAWFARQDMDADKQFWMETFAEPPAVLDLPTDHPRPPLQTFSGSSLTRTIPVEVRERVEDIARRTGSTEAMVMMAAWGAVLGRYGRTDDLVVGMPVSGRIHPDAETMLGMFVNTVPIRMAPHADEPFEQFLAQVRETMVESLSHQSYPLDAILDQIDLPRDLSRNPLFDTVLVFQNFAQPGGTTSEGGDPDFVGMTSGEGDSGGIRMTRVPNRTVGANLDLSVYVTPLSDAGFEVEIQYRTDLFEEDTIDYFFRHLETFLAHATASPATAVGEVSMIDDNEQSFLNTLDDTVSPVRDVTVVDLFDEQAASQPDRAAVICDGREWSYRELDAHARQVAARLRDVGAQGRYVALLVGRGLPMVAAILGVLKAGAAYVPMDADLPPARIEAMLDACQPAAVVTDGGLPDGIHGACPCPVIDLGAILTDPGSPRPGDGARSAEQAYPSLDDPAYCIFTSGSTGVPKGVVVTHHNLTAFAQEPGLQSLFAACDRPRFLATADYSFDMSVTEWFAGLCRGIPVVVANDAECVSQHAFSRLVASSGATIIQATPTRLRMLTADPEDRAYLARIELFLIGGESVPEDLLQLVRTCSTAPIWIMYGPTEATCWSTMGRWDGGPVSIGRALANVEISVRDGDRECGIGVPGEVWISGSGIAQGYLGDPMLTSEKFVQSHSDDGTRRYYRTGDLALRKPDGTLMFLGRIDTQVKVHGVRIETGEVETAIRCYPGVTGAVVVARPVQHETVLCAYYTADLAVDVEELRHFVAERLPRTMLPSYWTALDQLPVNRSGKTDVSALPDPEVHFAGYVAPTTPTQHLVADVMRDVLGLEKVGAHDDFFALGGDSLTALQLVNQIEARAGAHLRLQDVFQNPCVDSLADAVENRSGGYEPIVSVGGSGIYPTTPQQRDMLHNVDDEAYHVSLAVRVHGRLDTARVEQVFQQLVDRHEELRTAFLTQADGQIVQEVRDHAEARIETTRITDASDAAARELLTRFVRPFDLSAPPLIRFMVAEGPDDQSLILIDAHHVLVDGSSMTILIEEFSRAYRGEVLPPVKVTYKDYAAWLSTQDQAPAEAFWSALLEDLPATLEMPLDHPRPSLLTFTDGGVNAEFSAELRSQAENLARQTSTTEAMVVFASLGVVLGRWSHSEDLLIGMVVNGRNHPDTTDMLGMFVTALPLRVRPRLDSSFTDYLSQVRDVVVPALTYQSYPLESIITLIGPEPDPSRSPLIDQLMAFQNFTQADMDLPGITSELILTDDTGVRVDLAFFVLPEDGRGYEVTLDYRTCLYSRETIGAFFRDWKAVLDCVTVSPGTSLGEIELGLPN